MHPMLIQYYRELESDLNVRLDSSYECLVHPTDSYNAPVHNWYRFKEGYSPNLITKIVEKSGIKGKINLLDPFCGSGTTLLSFMEKSNIGSKLNTGVGIEVNPFIHFMAKTKLNFWQLKTNIASDFVRKIHLSNLNSLTETGSLEAPILSTIPKAFSTNTLAQLLSLKNIIKKCFNPQSYEHDFFMLALASILESVSCMRKTGRALKQVRSQIDYDVKSLFVEKCTIMINDVIENSTANSRSNVCVHNGDIRNFSFNNNLNFNLVIFSPPYLNHFDYTEIYKIELWMLDFVNCKSEFRNLRYSTFRSHPSIKFEETSYYRDFGSSTLLDLIDSLNDKPDYKIFYNSLKGYVDDMYLTLKQIDHVTTSDATIACVVANSLFGSIKKDNLTPIATDLLISEVARNIGYDIAEIKVARKIARRGLQFPYGRESIIFMKKRETKVKRNDINKTCSLY